MEMRGPRDGTAGRSFALHMQLMRVQSQDSTWSPEVLGVVSGVIVVLASAQVI